jgi:cell division protein FtsQ
MDIPRPRTSKRNRRKAAGAGWLALSGASFSGEEGRQWRRLASVAGFLVLVALIGYGLVFAIDRPVRTVEVAGRFQRVTPTQVEEAVTRVLKAGTADTGILSADLAEVRQSVERLTWVERARVVRSWPSGLRVEIDEQVPAARWGEAGLLNTHGKLFVRDAQHLPPELPLLNGPEGSEWQVAQLYMSTQGQLIEAGTRLTALTLDARGALQLKLANGIQVRFGRRQVEERLDCFIRTALPYLAGRAAEVNYVDMRYSNGFAIGWKGDRKATDNA